MNTTLRCVIAAFILVLALASPGLAQSSAVSNWTNPGEFPFEGTPQEACDLHSNNLNTEQCLRAIAHYEAGTCDVMYLQDGDIIDVSFTASGVHKKRTLRVMFGNQYGPNDQIRLAQACSTNRPDGVHMVRPQVCGNWSVMTLLPPILTPAPTSVEVVSPPEKTVRYVTVQVCQPTGSVYIPGQTISVPGVAIEGCPTQYVSPMSITTSGVTSTTQVCYYVQKEVHDELAH